MKLYKKNIIASRPNKTVYRADDQIVKLFHEGHPKSGVFKEAFIHSAVEESGLPVPELRGVEHLDGGWALITERVEGTTLAELLVKDPENYEKYINLLIDIQLEVNRHTAPGLKNTLDKMAEKINSLKEEIDPSTRYELLQRIHGMRRHTKICHGDLVPSNIIIREDGSYEILDWAHATQGNAGADAAITYLRFSLKNEKYAEYYLNTYCIRSDTAKQYIQQWMPVVAAYQLTKHVESEKELLEKWISVAEYM